MFKVEYNINISAHIFTFIFKAAASRGPKTKNSRHEAQIPLLALLDVRGLRMRKIYIITLAQVKASL